MSVMEKGKGKFHKPVLIITDQLRRTAAEDARDTAIRPIFSWAPLLHGNGAMSTVGTIRRLSRTKMICASCVAFGSTAALEATPWENLDLRPSYPHGEDLNPYIASATKVIVH